MSQMYYFIHPWKQCCWGWWLGGSQSAVISTVFSLFNSRLFWLHQRTSCSTSRLKTDSSPSCMRLMTVVLSTNFRRLTDGSPEVQSLVQREKSTGKNTGKNTHPWGSSADCPDAGCDFPQPLLLLPACQEVCDALTDRSWHSELGWVWCGGFQGWWCWMQSWSPRTGFVHMSLGGQGVTGWNVVWCWLPPPVCSVGKLQGV